MPEANSSASGSANTSEPPVVLMAYRYGSADERTVGWTEPDWTQPAGLETRILVAIFEKMGSSSLQFNNYDSINTFYKKRNKKYAY